ncbi:inositol-tetrakisphosphate 1-kinase 5-like [Zingiber officinale]|uniref:inositol-tetrakisphosphate 1-kinase 5-like n=1 Tax=Zingiber officinale TaxID=94328 RepID=UPI001C4CDFE5|nr:inositol-tetrakisphosphate 1-kinase 5-like [Zingiber officinale]
MTPRAKGRPSTSSSASESSARVDTLEQENADLKTRLLSLEAEFRAERQFRLDLKQIERDMQALLDQMSATPHRFASQETQDSSNSPDPNVDIYTTPSSYIQISIQLVSQIDVPNGTESIGVPKQVLVDDSSHDPLSETKDLWFPIIDKPHIFVGSIESHTITLLFHPIGLLRPKPPVVFQEFVNHGGVMFKVYVVGDYVQCVCRPRLKAQANKANA